MVAAAAGVVGAAPLAFAAGNGYSPGTPTPGGTAPGLPGSVVCVNTEQPSGGKPSCSLGSATITVTVPPGTFSGPTQVVVTDAGSSSVTPPRGGAVVLTFGLGFYQNGSKVAGTFAPVTVTVSDPSITSGSSVYFVINGVLQPVSGATISNGSVTFKLSSDPTVEVTSPASTSSAQVAGATTVHTGEPFLLEGGLAALLVLGGSALLILAVTRRRA